MDRLLRGVIGVGATAAVALVIGVIIVLVRNNNRTPTVALPPTVVVTTPPQTVAPPAVPPTPGPPVELLPATRCAQSGQQCPATLVGLINGDRQTHGRAALVYDHVQSHGVPSIHCVGSEGHSRAMASTGRIWHVDRNHPHAGYPVDICITTSASAENVAIASGNNEWVALSQLEARIVGARGKDRRRLLSKRFRHVGIGIMQRGNQYYVTEDFLR